MYDGVKYGTLECKHMNSWNKYGDECDLRMQMYWFVAIDVLGGVVGIGPSPGQGQPVSGAGWWFPPFFLVMMFMLEMIYL